MHECGSLLTDRWDAKTQSHTHIQRPKSSGGQAHLNRVQQKHQDLMLIHFLKEIPKMCAWLKEREFAHACVNKKYIVSHCFTDTFNIKVLQVTRYINQQRYFIILMQFWQNC